jgi:transcriptional regulator with XRE-family HTH domain
MTVSDIAAARLREVRKRRGWQVADLAARCAALGAGHLTENTIENIESGRRSDGRRRRALTVDELLALAAALSVAPVHLLVPPYPSPLWGGDGDSRSPDDPNVPNDNEPYVVTPDVDVPCWQARQFIRGHHPLPGMDAWDFYGEAPPHERPSGEQIQQLVDAAPLQRWMTGE